MALGQVALVLRDLGMVAGQHLAGGHGALERHLSIRWSTRVGIEDAQVVVARGQVALVLGDLGMIAGQRLVDGQGLLERLLGIHH